MMKNKAFLSLVTLNVVLLGILAFGGLGKPAQAQQVARARGRYGMVSGVVQNVYPGVVYIVDESNQDMVAVMWLSSRYTMMLPSITTQDPVEQNQSGVWT